MKLTITDRTTSDQERRADFTFLSCLIESGSIHFAFNNTTERKLALGELAELEIEATRNEDGSVTVDTNDAEDFGFLITA